MTKKTVVAGLGEIGKPLLQLVSKAGPSIGYDINEKLIDEKKYEKFKDLKTSLLHIAIPFSDKFAENVLILFNKFKPEIIVIHSTISPNTTKQIQHQLSIPVIYSATRGVHKRMFHDMKRYTKFYAIEPTAPNAQWAAKTFSRLMKKCGVKTKRMSNPVTLELAKIVCDTSYYGWLIIYAQLSNMMAMEYKVNYDEMWSFSDEIHKFLGNRPKMFPGYIGGHCVIPNLDLIHNKTLDLIKILNEKYSEYVKIQ